MSTVSGDTICIHQHNHTYCCADIVLGILELLRYVAEYPEPR